MESMTYFRRIYGVVPWNPLIPWNQRQKSMAFHKLPQFLFSIYLPSTAMETLKTPSEYSVDFNRGFQRFSMANIEKGISLTARGLFCYKVESRLFFSACGSNNSRKDVSIMLTLTLETFLIPL